MRVRWRKGEDAPKDGTVILLRGTAWLMHNGDPEVGMMLVKWDGDKFVRMIVTLNHGMRSEPVFSADLERGEWVPLNELL